MFWCVHTYTFDANRSCLRKTSWTPASSRLFILVVAAAFLLRWVLIWPVASNFWGLDFLWDPTSPRVVWGFCFLFYSYVTFFHVLSHFAFFYRLMWTKYFLLLATKMNLQMRRLNLGNCKSMGFTRSRFTRHFRYELSGHRLDSVYYICDLGVFLEA
jgi:hypothetical protein